jgi:hypothetical protein
MDDIQTTFNSDSVDVLVEDGEVHEDENNKAE